MDKFGEKVTVVQAKKKELFLLKHTVNFNVFYNWALNITIYVVMFFALINLIKLLLMVM